MQNSPKLTAAAEIMEQFAKETGLTDSQKPQHDLLDGYLTCLELEESAPEVRQRQVTELGELCRNKDWTTDDPLGIGSILYNCLRTLRLAEIHTKQLLPWVEHSHINMVMLPTRLIPEGFLKK